MSRLILIKKYELLNESVKSIWGIGAKQLVCAKCRIVSVLYVRLYLC